jgi:hypothetical protein
MNKDEIMKVLFGVQVSKGKFYSEVIGRMLPGNPEEAVQVFLSGILKELMMLKIIKSEMEIISRRLRQTEFDGSAYMPLPTESQIVKTVKDVQREMMQDREEVNLYPPPPFDMPEELKGKSVDELMQMALNNFLKY